jgi:hypothetical protein
MKRRKSPFRPRGAGTRKTTKIKTLRRAAVGERASPRTRNLPSTEADRARPRNLIEQPTTPAEEKLLANFSERVRARHTAPKVKVTLDSAQPKVEWAGHPQTTLLAQLATFGTISPDFYSQTFGELQNASCSGPGRQFDEMEVNGMLGTPTIMRRCSVGKAAWDAAKRGLEVHLSFAGLSGWKLGRA